MMFVLPIFVIKKELIFYAYTLPVINRQVSASP